LLSARIDATAATEPARADSLRATFWRSFDGGARRS